MLKKYFPLLFVASALAAIEPGSDFTISTGWRTDEIKTFIRADATVTGAPAFGPYKSHNLQVRDIRIAELGLQCQFAIPPCWCDCDTWWISQFYLKGYAYTGHIYSGKYSLYNRNIPETNSDTRTGNLASVHGGRSRNYDIGLGWLYPLCEDWGFGLITGYSYDRLDVRIKNVLKVQACSVDDDSCSSTFFSAIDEGAKYKNRWEGPWLGFNFLFENCNWRLDMGYEYHWARWKGQYQLAGLDSTARDCTGFSDTRTGNRGHGNVVYANATMYWWDCWEVMLGTKYTAFTISGRMHPARSTFTNLGCPADEIDHIKHNKWKSFQITLDVGYWF